MKQVIDLLGSNHQALAETLIKSADSQHFLVELLLFSKFNCKIREFLASKYCTLEIIDAIRTDAYIIYMRLLCVTNPTPLDKLLIDKITDIIREIEQYRKDKL